MFAARKTDNVSSAANYIEDVFSTYLYTGNGSVQTIPNGIAIGSAYGGSVFFDGSDDRISVASNTALDLTGDFTMECWFYQISAISAYPMIFGTSGGTIGTESMFTINYPTNGVLNFNNPTLSLNGGAISNNTWYHVAVTRSGSTTRMFVNGELKASSTSSLTMTTGQAWLVGDRPAGAGGANYPFNGFVSNARVVKGTAVYTSAFTPPTAPLTAISGTSLLTCKTPNAVLDYSSNAFTITVTNAVAQNGGGPFTDSTANKGGMVWLKSRSAATDHALYDTNRGATFDLVSNSTAAQTTQTTGLTSFNANGFSIGALAKLNTSAATYVSWTFRKQAKFFDVVTYTGNGANRTIAHNLGSVPGCIMVKRTDTTGAWQVYHRSLANTQYLVLNTTALVATGATRWNSTTPTSTEFSLGTEATVNASGGTYVAYLFAHDAGGFGAAGTDNVISCGSYTGNATLNSINLGYEPQFLLIKRTSGAADVWLMIDVMRGLNAGSSNVALCPNTGSAEAGDVGIQSAIRPTATGFDLLSGDQVVNANGSNYIYIAIRRGPMKTPTSGTSVFYPLAIAQTNTPDSSGVPFPPDLVNTFSRNGTSRADTLNNFQMLDRLRGLGIPVTTYNSSTGINAVQLISSSTAAETSSINAAYVTLLADSQNITRGSGWNSATYGNWINYFWRRAPGFFDVVCYTGTGANRTVTHNLGVVPELMIIKCRSASNDWAVYANNDNTDYLLLNLTAATADDNTYWNDTSPTASVFSVGTNTDVNMNAETYVAYLFASVTGVSKVGSYTGNGSSQTINCGFAAGARFILIKRTNSTGDWYVWDTARGIVAGNDPRLSLNTTAAEVTTDDSIDPDNSGFIVNQLAATNINVNAATYIYLAIA